MFYPTQPLARALRRLRLTTKMTTKGYYKGNRTGRMGSHTKWGGYRIDASLVRTYRVPADLATFELTPFVAERIKRPHGGKNKSSGSDPNSKMTAENYLQRWKDENGAT